MWVCYYVSWRISELTFCYLWAYLFCVLGLSLRQIEYRVILVHVGGLYVYVQNGHVNTASFIPSHKLRQALEIQKLYNCNKIVMMKRFCRFFKFCAYLHYLLWKEKWIGIGIQDVIRQFFAEYTSLASPYSITWHINRKIASNFCICWQKAKNKQANKQMPETLQCSQCEADCIVWSGSFGKQYRLLILLFI
jgi:hypothetical protein